MLLSNENVDAKTVESFRLLVAQQLEEAVEFALNRRENLGESDVEELRQVAQDAATELTGALVDSLIDAYKRSPLATVDYSAIAIIFQKLAIRAKLVELLQRVNDEHIVVSVHTRRGNEKGELRAIVEHDGMESLYLMGDDNREIFIPMIAITDLDYEI